MDGTAAIQDNIQALKRILAGLVGMAGLASTFTSPLWGSEGRARQVARPGVGVIAAPQPPPDASRRPPLKGEVKPVLTLPRHLRLAILRLLRPAEAAARRLIIAAARGLTVTLPPPRNRKARLATVEPTLRRFGIAVVISPADIARDARILPRSRVRGTTEGGGGGGPCTMPLPLFDPPRRHRILPRRRTVPAHAAPRILLPGLAKPHTLPPPPSPDDPIDATRLGYRLAALAAALDDLPGQARRFARWKALRARGRIRRAAPLRPGRPPGGRLVRFDPAARSGRNIREVDEILAHAHALALHALQYPDTS